MSRMLERIALTTIALLVASAGTSQAGNAVVGNCANDIELRAAMATVQAGGGGTISFNCGVATIAVTTPLPVTESVVLDGDDKITISGSNSSRVFEVSGLLTLDSIVVTKGSSLSDGGAIYNTGMMFVQNSKITDSVSGGSGGAIVTYGAVFLTDSEISGNKALNGGGIYARFAGAPVNIQRCQFFSNEATDVTNAWGGAILLWDGASVTIDGSNFNNNTARAGGAIYNSFSNSSVFLEDSVFTANTASAASGGAVVASGPFTARDVTFSSNHAAYHGGAVEYEGSSTSSITRSAFVQNYAGHDGGGLIAVDATKLTVSNTTFFNNFAEQGAAFANTFSTVSLVNVTMANNVATAGASGILSNNDQPGGTTVQNSIIASSNNGANCAGSVNGLNSADGNLSDDSSCAAFFNKLHDLNGAANDPKLGAPELNGGTTRSLVPQPGSPAIDGGVANSLTVDQRGFSRPQGSAVDRGSVEVVPCEGGPALCGDANQNGSLAAGDALLALRAAVGSGSCALWLCDANGSGDLSASDALLILRKSVGQPVSSSCPPKWDCFGG